jgi:hypothetical protein
VVAARHARLDAGEPTTLAERAQLERVLATHEEAARTAFGEWEITDR